MSHTGNMNKNKTQYIKIREIAKAMLIKEMEMKTTMRYFILNDKKRLSFLIVQMQQSLL